MANDDGKKFDIQIGTEADTSGLKEVDQSLVKITDTTRRSAEESKKAADAFGEWQKKLKEQDRARGSSALAVDPKEYFDNLEKQATAEQDAAEAAVRAAAQRKQAEADVEEAIKRRAAREKEALEAEKAASRDRVALGLLLVGAVREIAQATTQAAGEFQKLGVEVPPTMEALEKTIHAITSPMEEIIDLATGYKEELKALAESKKLAAEQEKLYHETEKKHLQELATLSRERISNYLAQEKAALASISEEYERQVRVAKALAELDEVRAQSADKRALANGADPTQVAAGAAARGAARDSGALDAQIAKAQAAFDAAIRAYDSAENVYNLARDTAGTNREQLNALFQDVVAAQQAIDGAKSELATVTAEVNAAKEGVIIEAADKLRGLQADVGDGIAAEAQKVVDAVKAKAEAEGGKVGRLAEQSMGTIVNIISDNIPDSLQTEQLKQAMLHLRTSIEGRDKDLFGIVTSAISAIEHRDSQIGDLKNRVKKLEDQRGTRLSGP